MGVLTTADMLLFEDFRLSRSGLSRRDQSGTFAPIPIGARALKVLGVLVAHSGELVTRDEIIKKVWPGTIVEYSNLPVQIAALRRVLDHGRTQGSCIQTVPGRGYRFVVAVANPVAEARWFRDWRMATETMRRLTRGQRSPRFQPTRASDGRSRATFWALFPQPAVSQRFSRPMWRVTRA